MAIQKLFNIAAHFKFEVGAAQVNIAKLDSGFNKLSKTLEGVNEQAKLLFSAHTLALTGGAAGIVGTMQKMVSSSESYYQFQRKISTIIVANTKGQANFNDAMRTSSSIIKDLAKDAQKLSLPIESYKRVFSDLAGPMAAKGVAGKNFENTRGLAKNFMMMSRVFPMSEIELQNVLAGFITNQNPLFRLLTQDTEAFKGMTANRWRGLKYPQRIKKLQEGFKQYSQKNPEIAESFKNSLTGQLIELSNSFKDITSVMKTMGDIIRSVLVPVLKKVNEWIGNQLKRSFDTIAKTIQPLTKDLGRLYIEFEKLRRLGGTFDFSAIASGFAFFIVEFKKFLPMILGFATKLGLLGGRGALGATAGLMSVFKWVMKTDSVFVAFAKTLGFLAKSIGSYLAFLIPITAVMRVVDSAKAQAKLADMKKYAEELPEITEKTSEVARAFAALQFPLSGLINKVGESISFLFQKTWWVEKIYNILKKFDISALVLRIAKGFILVGSVFEQFIAKIFDTIFNFAFNPSKLKTPIKAIMEVWSSFDKDLMKVVDKRFGNVEDHFDKYMKDAEKPPAPVYNNYAPITIRNQFPENMEPDRIAVSIKEAFMKSEQARIDSDRRQQTFTPATAYAR